MPPPSVCPIVFIPRIRSRQRPCWVGAIGRRNPPAAASSRAARLISRSGRDLHQYLVGLWPHNGEGASAAGASNQEGRRRRRIRKEVAAAWNTSFRKKRLVPRGVFGWSWHEGWMGNEGGKDRLTKMQQGTKAKGRRSEIAKPMHFRLRGGGGLVALAFKI